MSSTPKFPDHIVGAVLLVETENRAVFRAHDEEAGRDVVIKCLQRPYSDEEAAAFRNEYLRLEAIDHPNWVRPDDFFALPSGALAFSLEYSDGETFDRFPLRGWTPETLEVARQILSGLHALHVNGLAQLDLKPEQLLIGWPGEAATGWEDPGPDDQPAEGESDGSGVPPRPSSVHTSTVVDGVQVHMFDLGLSSPFGTPIPATGTPGYMAPELLRREEAWDARADLYAFGALLYELLMGEKLFRADSAGEILKDQMAGPNLDPIYRGGQIPRPLVRLLQELLDPEPNYRPQTATEVWARLRETATGQTTRSLPINLTGARRLPFVGREAEVEAFIRWLSKLETSGEAKGRCVIRGELGLGARRLRNRLVAIARTRGWTGSAEECCYPDGATMQVDAVVQSPTFVSCAASTWRRGNDTLVVDVGTLEERSMRRLAVARGLTASSLIDEVVRVSLGRPSLVDGLASSLLPLFDSAARNGTVRVEEMLGRTLVPAGWLGWAEMALSELSSPDLQRLEDAAMIRGAGGESRLGPLPESILWTKAILANLGDAKDALRRHEVLANPLPPELARAAFAAGAPDPARTEGALTYLFANRREYEAFRLFVEACGVGQAELVSETNLLLIAKAILGGNLHTALLGADSAKLMDGKLGCAPVFETLSLPLSHRERCLSAFLESNPPNENALLGLWIRAGLALDSFGPGKTIENKISSSTSTQSKPRIELERMHAGKRGEAQRSLDVVVECLEGELSPLEAATLTFLKGSFLFYLDRLDDAEAVYRDALEKDRAASNGARELQILGNLGGVLFESGQLGKLHEVLTNAADRAQSELKWGVTKVVLSNLALVSAMRGYLADAARLANQVRALAVATGTPEVQYAKNISSIMDWIGRNDYFLDCTSDQRRGLDAFDEAVFTIGTGMAGLRVLDAGSRRLIEDGLSKLGELGASADIAEFLAAWGLCEMDLQNYEVVAPILSRLRSGAVPSAAWSNDAVLVELEAKTHGIVEHESDLVAAWTELRERTIAAGAMRLYWRTEWGRARALRLVGDGSESERARGQARAALLQTAESFSDPRDVKAFLSLPACALFLAG